MKSRSNRFLALASLASAILTFSASAATWQWDGGAGTDNWQTPDNWNPNGANNNFNNTFADRLNVNGTQALTYTVNEGTTNYGSGSVRGLVIGSGTAGSGTMNITGGTFSTLNAGTNLDIIGNSSNNTGTLNISGGTFIGASGGTSMNIGGALGSGRVSNLNISGTGTATLTSLILNGVTININLNGGLLELNGFTNTSIQDASKIRFNSGTLKARQNNAAFLTAAANLEALVQSGGAVIDTNGFNITIAEPLLEDAGSTGGGITKNGEGLLTLSQPSTTTGPADVNAGGLSVKAGLNSWTPSSFTHSGDTLNFDLGVYSPSNPAAIDTPTLTVDSAITVNVTGSSFQVGQIPLINYGSKSITGSLTLNTASLPTNVVATLVDDNAGTIYLDVTAAPTTYVWSGDINADATGVWDTVSLNWNNNADFFSTAGTQIVDFPNIAAGGTVTLDAAGAFSPLAVNIANATGNPYTFDGTGKITGATALNKSNSGRVTFASGANDYSGATTISGGAIIKQAADATTGNITVTGDNMSFVLSGGITDGAGQTLFLAGRGITTADYFFPTVVEPPTTGSQVQRGALQSHFGANTWAGNIVLTSNSATNFNRIGVQPGASLTLTGDITENVVGAYLLFRAGALGEDITLGGAGTYSYTNETQMFSNGGSVILGNDNKLPTGELLNLTSNGATVFDMNGNDQELAGIYGGAFGSAATITNNGSGPSVLTTSPIAATTQTSNAFFADGSNIISIVKNGDGTQVLGFSNTYSGTTTVNAGTLLINGDQSGATGAVQVNNTATLGGNGTVGGETTVAVGGTLAPGGVAAINSLDIAANTTIAGTLACDVNAATTDQLTVAGDLTLSGPLSINEIAAGTPGTYVIATYTGTRSGALDVTSLPPGYSVNYDDANQEVELVIAAPGGYTAWASSNSVLLGENGDDDKDGIINLVEYALGLDPQVSSTPAGTFNGSSLTFVKGTEAKTAGDVTYSIETSTTLLDGSWSTAAAVETADDISFTLPSGQGKIFGRLKVTKP
jgi:fibronectin-binding autotransporter adhesin